MMSRTGWPSTLVTMQPGVEARIVGGAFGQHGFDDGLRGLGDAALAAARGLRGLLRHILRRINAHVNTAFPLPFARMPSIFRSISW